MSLIKDLIISPSLLAADCGHFARAAQEAETGGAEYLHFDVMDGTFVPNISFGMGVVKALRPVSKAFFDVHLMIVQPEKYLEEFVRSGADGVTVQVEACVHLQRTLAQIRKFGAKAGVALNPATPLNILEYVLEDLDLILIMTVNPGFGGQEFLRATLPKIKLAQEMIASVSHPIQLEVDGGITAATIGEARACGANAFVAGTSIFGHTGGTSAGIQELRRSAEIGGNLAL